MANTVERKSRPAGINDEFYIGYTNFATNRTRSELKVGNGHEFDNEKLLEELGFKKGADGTMTLGASSNEVEKDEKGKVIRRTEQGRVLTDTEKSEQERD